MNRNRFALAVIALVILGLWLLLRGDAEVPLADTPNPQRPVHAAANKAPIDAELRRTAEPAAPPPTSTAAAQGPGVAVNSARGLRGVVKEPGDFTVPNVRLELVDSAGKALASVVSDQQGRFSFSETVPSGASLVTQLLSGAGPRIRHPTPPRGRGRQRSHTMTVWLPPTGAIEGTVVDAAGLPVEGASVATDKPLVLLGMTRTEVLSGPKPTMTLTVQTDSAGRFAIPFAKRGTHRLRASHDGVEGSIQCKPGDPAVVLRLGTHLGGAVVLEGQLRDRASGAPIAGARVFVQLVREWAHGRSANGVARVVTDDRGRYLVEGLDVGRYELTTMPDGYAPAEQPARDFSAGRHTVDFALDLARELLVRVVQPDGSPPSRADIRVIDASGRRLEVPNQIRVMTDSLRLGPTGEAQLRRLPAVAVTVLAIRGDLFPAGRLDVDLGADPPQEVTIVLPTGPGGFARKHYFQLLGPDGQPAVVEGIALAESYDGSALVSRVEGHWRGDEFVFGHDESNGFTVPTIAIGAPAGPCRVDLTVPGYAQTTLTLEPDAKSPTSVRLRR